MSKRISANTERLLTQYESLLPSFAMYFVHERSCAAALASECLLAYVDKQKKNEKKVDHQIFLFREIRRKCFEYLSAGGKPFESSFVLSEEALKKELSSGEEQGKLYKDMLLLAESFRLLQEQEREIIFLVLFASLTCEECALVLDKNAGEIEEHYWLALMKLNTKISGKNEQKNPDDPAGEMIKLRTMVSFLLARCGEKAILAQENKEKILVCASARVPFDYRKALYKCAAILLFCVITVSLLIHSHIQGEPDLHPEVNVGVFMPEEEQKAKLLQEKARQEKILLERRKDLTAVQLSIHNFPSSSGKIDTAMVERRLKKLGVDVKVYKVEMHGINKEKIYLYVAAPDALKISRNKKILK